MRRFGVYMCVLATTVLFLPRPATAQTGGDLAVGYSFLTNDQLAANAGSLPLGWFFDTSFELNEAVSIAFDVNGHYRRGIDPSDTYSGGPMDMPVPPNPNEDFQAFSFNRPEAELLLAGPDRLPREHPDGQRGRGSAGSTCRRAASGRTSTRCSGPVRSLRKINFFAHTATHLAIQPGGGVDIDMTPNTAFRVQARLPADDVPDAGPERHGVDVVAGESERRGLQGAVGLGRRGRQARRTPQLTPSGVRAAAASRKKIDSRSRVGRRVCSS